MTTQEQLEAAFGLLCNIDLSTQKPEWQEAFARLRDAYGSPTPEPLTFQQLRAANIARIPLFKNRRGQRVHEPGGMDWTVTQWFRSMMGECGEFAGWEKKFELGEISYEIFMYEASRELADIQTYLDILALRMGVDLGEITRIKFNEVSDRIGCSVKL